MRGQFTAAVPRQRGHQARGKRAHRPRERTDDADGVFPRQPDEEDEAGSPLDQGRDVRVSGARQQVALPVPRPGPVRRLRRTLADGHRINDAPARLSGRRGLPRLAPPPPAAEMGEQFFFQHATTLHEQTHVDRLVRHLEVRMVRKGLFQPPRDLLR